VNKRSSFVHKVTDESENFIHVVGFDALSNGPDSDQNVNSPTTIQHFLRKNSCFILEKLLFYLVSVCCGRVERAKESYRNIF
jgi:hypothetical protein